jgi:hypothetical protein
MKNERKIRGNKETRENSRNGKTGDMMGRVLLDDSILFWVLPGDRFFCFVLVVCFRDGDDESLQLCWTIPLDFWAVHQSCLSKIHAVPRPDVQVHCHAGLAIALAIYVT